MEVGTMERIQVKSKYKFIDGTTSVTESDVRVGETSDSTLLTSSGL